MMMTAMSAIPISRLVVDAKPVTGAGVGGGVGAEPTYTCVSARCLVPILRVEIGQ